MQVRFLLVAPNKGYTVGYMEQPKSQLDELQDLLEESIELTKENNRLLKAMRRDALIGGIVKTLVWVAVLGASLYFSWLFLEPFIGSVQGAAKGMNPSDYQALFDFYKEQLGQ